MSASLKAKKRQAVKEWFLSMWSNRNTIIKALISMYPGIAAVFLAFNKDRIVDNSRINARADFDFLVLFYWIFLFLWIVNYFRTLLKESDANKKNIADNKDTLRDIKSAILRAPNPMIFSEYNFRFKKIISNFNVLRYYLNGGGKQAKEAYEAALVKNLNEICELTQIFFQRDNVICGANIMLYIQNNDENARIVNHLISEKKLMHFGDLRIEAYHGILYGVEKLKFSNKISDEKEVIRDVPTVSLPILVNDKNPLPGACKAAIAGEAIINDVSQIEKNYQDFGRDVRDKERDFFLKDSVHVKSYVSIAIPKSGIPFSVIQEKGLPAVIGVLNIDCNQKNIVGEVEEYHETYYCLIKPIISHFSSILDEYLEKFRSELI